jgi:uncharacterized membrane protein (DUF2068 family)
LSQLHQPCPSSATLGRIEEPMKRLPGIVLSAIILLLGSLFQLLAAVGMGAAGVLEKIQIVRAGNPATGVAVGNTAVGPAAALPTWMPIFMYVLAGLFAVLATWGFLTSVGLFRMHRWARYSVMVIGGCLAVIGLSSMLLSLVMLFIPLPTPTTVDPSQMNTVHGFTKIIFGAVAAFYGVVGGIGVFWLVYFNLKKVRAAFAGVTDTFVPGPRPILISMIAVLEMIGVVTMAVLMFLPFGATFLIWILQGWQKIVFALLYGALLAAAAYGLWHLKEWGRRLAIAVQLVGLAQYITFLVRPYVFAKYNAQVQAVMKMPQQYQQTAQFNQEMIYFSMGLGMLFLIAILIILHYYRGKFGAPAEPPQSAIPALP